MTEPESPSLGSDLPRLMAHVRDNVLPAYLEIGPTGGFGVMMMRKDLDDAAGAMMAGDVVEMIRVYASLKGWHT